MSSFWWGQSALDDLVEKATSELLPAGQVDLALHLEISDQIRSKKVTSKDAIRAFKQRLSHKNPNVVLATLSLVDTCVKNSGSVFVREVATRDFMEEVTHVLKTGSNQDVKSKALYLIQIWGIAAKHNPSLTYITGTYNLLQAEGYTFPPVTEKVDSILLETAIAPEWTDSDVCERCRTSFTLTNRKHHCRNCGGTFCQQCSSKNVSLPHLGINDSVRVCDGCYIKVKLAKVADKDTVSQLLGNTIAPSSSSSSLIPTYAPSTSQKTIDTNKEDDQFEIDMKKALEMSLKDSQPRSMGYIPSAATSSPVKSKSPEEEAEDADLQAAITASLADLGMSHYSQPHPTSPPAQDRNELSLTDMENIQLFSTLMQRVQSTDVSGDQHINQLYSQIGSLQPKLVYTLNETCKKHETFIQLHNKLNEAVKAYDRLIHERLSRTQRNQPSFGSMSPYANYSHPPATPLTSAQPSTLPSIYAYPTDMHASVAAPPQPMPFPVAQPHYAFPGMHHGPPSPAPPTSNYGPPSTSQPPYASQSAYPAMASSTPYPADMGHSSYSQPPPAHTQVQPSQPVVDEKPLIEL
ncbi:hypothetical protein BY458DRAFT_527825 [Sporodiniella umbellata]|nr:hypothetical protein BY458DRAFT_527825 [Sporodiniella umbellata]